MKTRMQGDLEACTKMQKDVEGMEEPVGLGWLPPSFTSSLYGRGLGNMILDPLFPSNLLGWTKGASRCVIVCPYPKVRDGR